MAVITAPFFVIEVYDDSVANTGLSNNRFQRFVNLRILRKVLIK